MSRTKVTFEVPITLEMTVVDNDNSPKTVEELLRSRIHRAASDIMDSNHVEDIDYELASYEAVATTDAPDVPQP